MTGFEIFLYALVIACGIAGLAYGVVTRGQVLALPAGNQRMQEIAAAIQEGANAYLRRQYTTIGIVGVVILVLLAILLGLAPAVGFAIGAILSGAIGSVSYTHLTLPTM